MEFSAVLGQAGGEVAFAPEVTSTAALMTLGGRASETIARNRGKAHRVVPLCPIDDGVFAWAGYREAWKKAGPEQNFRFLEGGFTLHVGREGEVAKPQILRSEWIGRRNAQFGNLAGHPHWQLDVLESARTRLPQPSVRFQEDDIEIKAVEFIADPVTASGEDLLLGLTIERMHLASGALWWRQPSLTLAHHPETVGDLDRWILGCLTYLRQEVGRCAILPIPA